MSDREGVGLEWRCGRTQQCHPRVHVRRLKGQGASPWDSKTRHICTPEMLPLRWRCVGMLPARSFQDGRVKVKKKAAANLVKGSFWLPNPLTCFHPGAPQQAVKGPRESPAWKQPRPTSVPPTPLESPGLRSSAAADKHFKRGACVVSAAASAGLRRRFERGGRKPRDKKTKQKTKTATWFVCHIYIYFIHTSNLYFT